MAACAPHREPSLDVPAAAQVFFVTTQLGWLKTKKILVQVYIPQYCKSLLSEAYHLEADNSDPMLGFFSQPIKIYFLIWSY